MLDDVAVPHELAGIREPQPQPGHLARVGDDGVLPAVLRGLRRGDRPIELNRLDDLAVLIQNERAFAKYAEVMGFNWSKITSNP